MLNEITTTSNLGVAVEVRTQMGKEVLQASALHDSLWADADPVFVDQKVEQWGDAHSGLLDRAVRNFRFDRESFFRNTRNLTVGERLLHLLTMAPFNFNSVQRVRLEPIWQERTQNAVRTNSRIELAYPLVCKIDNAAKRLTLVNCTAGERAIVRFFRELGHLVKEVYPPGLRIHILSDATLYNGALFVPPPTAAAYMRDVDSTIETDGAVEFVELHDYSSLLAPYYREFEESYSKHYARLASATAGSEDWGSLPTSVRTNINSRRLCLTYDQLKLLFGPRQVAFTPARADLDQQARFALMEQLAIKMACTDLDVPSRLWPNHIRATCHKGLKNGVAVLGLRCYPEYYGSSRLLPYHGMPLIEADRSGNPRLLILPEISLRGNSELVRVENEMREPVLYYRP